MSFKYRKQKRNLAALLLAEITEDSDFLVNSGPPDFDEPYWTVSTLTASHRFKTYDECRAAVQLLEFNKHVQCRYSPDEPPLGAEPLLYRTPAGTEALLEGFYDKENQKDNVERFELRTRGIE